MRDKVDASFSVLAETDANGNITTYYVYGLGLIAKITPQNQAYYYHYDGLGSTIAITDSTGSIVNQYAYDAHGKVISQTEGISNPFKYVGKYGVMDDGNGLLYMRARYYDPEMRRFINKDPIGFAGGDLNLYAYVGNNPANNADPKGTLGLDTFIKWGMKQIFKNIAKNSDPFNNDELANPPEEEAMNRDSDGDGIPDFFDDDWDNDGTPDDEQICSE
jgi:RHS repeat-associated protein